MVKKSSLLIFVFFTFFHVNAQVVNVDTGCLVGATLSFAGTLNGKNSYASISPVASLYWDNVDNRWELDMANSTPGSNDFIVFVNYTDTSQNPPSLTLGGWIDVYGFCGPINQIDGSGTVSVLPVELISFEAQVTTGTTRLFWKTASELNNEKFEIEESSDGQEFEKIGEVKGNGTTLEQREYSFDVKNPRNGISYYRLKQIDFDGQFEYSKTISVDFKGENEDIGEFYPNPSKSGLVNLDYVAQSNDKITISVFDITGKLMVNQSQLIARGNNNLSFDFSELITGIYFVKIDDEVNSSHRKLIIER